LAVSPDGSVGRWDRCCEPGSPWLQGRLHRKRSRGTSPGFFLANSQSGLVACRSGALVIRPRLVLAWNCTMPTGNLRPTRRSGQAKSSDLLR